MDSIIMDYVLSGLVVMLCVVIGSGVVIRIHQWMNHLDVETSIRTHEALTNEAEASIDEDNSNASSDSRE